MKWYYKWKSLDDMSKKELQEAVIELWELYNRLIEINAEALDTLTK